MKKLFVVAAGILMWFSVNGCNTLVMTDTVGHPGGFVLVKALLYLDPNKTTCGVQATIQVPPVLNIEACYFTIVADPMMVIDRYSRAQDPTTGNFNKANFIAVNLSNSWTGGPEGAAFEIVTCKITIPASTPIGVYQITAPDGGLSTALGQPQTLYTAGGLIDVVPS